MWCQEFMSSYSDTPFEKLPEHYDRLSVFVEMTGDGRWKRPTTGAREIADRLNNLNLTMTAGEWGMVTCQMMCTYGLIVVLASVDGRRWQILIVNRLAVAATAVVRFHYYVATTGGTDITEAVDGAGDCDCSASFQQRFEDWVTSLDSVTLARHRTAMNTGLSIALDFYASLERRRTDNRLRWRYYDRLASFTCTRNGGGGGRVHVGPRQIRKKYEWLALDHKYTKLWSIECYGSVAHEGVDEFVPDYIAVLVSGTVPDLKRPGDKSHREFVQLLVIDTCTRKIINDVLCFQEPSRLPILRLARVNSPYASSSSMTLSSSSMSSMSSSSLSHPSPPHPRSMPSTATAAISLMADCSDFLSSSSGSMDGFSTWDDQDDDDDVSDGVCGGGRCGDLIELRSRVTDNALKIRSGTAATTVLATGGCNQQQVVYKLNPRQLFIGCVPLHVKYGQLKLLFERFGEVTYVKVYDGYNKQTGAKMLHNYAFLFFKDEESVERAIAASPVPLDANWNLNVSRPHHHTTAVAASGLDR